MGITPAEIKRFYRSIQPFKHLSDDELNQITAKTKVTSLVKEETVFNEGDPANSVWILYQGRIQVFKYTSEGRPFAIESLGPGELFGTLCRLGGNGRYYPCTAIAAQNSSVFRLLDQTFLEYYTKNPAMLRGVCSLCSDRLKDVQDLRCTGQEAVPVRVATILLRLYKVHGPIVPFTKKELSELIGTTIETTFRTLADFQKKGFLTSHRGGIELKKPLAMEDFIEKK